MVAVDVRGRDGRVGCSRQATKRDVHSAIGTSSKEVPFLVHSTKSAIAALHFLRSISLMDVSPFAKQAVLAKCCYGIMWR